jgi:hypothetical protein
VFGGTSGGGGGGGALKLVAPTLVVRGQLLANGGAGGDAFIGNQRSTTFCDPEPGAAGGGGSGGVVYLASPDLVVASSATISAAGGVGGLASEFATGGAGGPGGLGRIRISAIPASCSVVGTFVPPLANGCAPSSAPAFAYVGVWPR